MRTKGFTLVELMLVVAILGILGALVLPVYQGHAAEAKSSSAKSNLHAIRAQIELYRLQHNGTLPVYASGGTVAEASAETQLTGISTSDGTALASKTPSAPFLYGPYVKKIPKNPFNNLNTIAYVALAADMATAADGTRSGWLYKRETGEIRVNYPGKDSDGMIYTDY